MIDFLSVVDRPRFGLFEISDALVHYAGKSGLKAREIRLDKQTIRQVVHFYWDVIFSGTSKKIILWSVGISYLFIPFLRLAGITVIVIVHEPGGLRQRLLKKDGFVYAIVVSIYELLGYFAQVRCTPNLKNAKGNLRYCPLLFKSNFDETFESINSLVGRGRHALVYLGRKDIRRCYDLFNEIGSQHKLDSDNALIEFPNEKLKTSLEKQATLSQAIAVLNVYRVDHNQSGVTPDSLSFGVPVIVSDYDAWANIISEKKMGVVIDHTEITMDSIITAINKVRSEFDEMRSAIKGEFSALFGFDAFLLHWAEILKNHKNS